MNKEENNSTAKGVSAVYQINRGESRSNQAFGSLPNALASGVKISGAKVLEGKALLGKVSKANNYCH